MDITEATTPTNQPRIPAVICFCAGYGGLERGIKRVLGKIRVLAFSEIEAYPVANLVSKMEEGTLEAAPVWTNLKTFPGKMFRDKVDILTGGFPCQPFSSAGKGAGDDEVRQLLPIELHRQKRDGAHRPTAEPSAGRIEWPSRPGEAQKSWEPPRAFRVAKVATESDLGGDSDGAPTELDATERRMENRADRLKLCGNGVVPQTAERAYRVLSEKQEIKGKL